MKRGNSIFNTTDEFDYDSQDRLIKYPDAAGNITFQDYDNKGKIKANSIGNYAYTIPGKPYQVSTVTPPFVDAPPQMYYEAREQNVQYNFFKSPVSVSVANKETIYFEYNDFNQRSGMFYGGASPSKVDKKFQRFYSSDGSMEITYNIATDTVDFINYVGGDAYTAPLAIKSENDIDTPLYLHRDYQGSILAITDEQGLVLEARLFDAWGQLVKLQIKGIAVPLPEGTEGSGLLLDRGYTGHEHLLGVELINMNGRLYDPAFHRFLQPDNYVQDPSNTQNYNRYAYCYNNPLKFTDPSGEIIWFIIGAAVLGGVINWGVHGFRTDMEGLKAFGIGALAGTAGALTGGAAAAGLAGFQAGAVGAFFGSLISTPILSIGNNLAFGDPLLTPKQFIFGVITATIMGGVISGGISALQGNNFWNGAPPRVAVEAITIKPVEIVSRTEMPKADLQKVGLPSTTKPSVQSTNHVQTANKITISKNIDGNGYKVEGAGIKTYNTLQDKFGDTYESVSAVKGKYLDVEYGNNLNLNSKGVYYKVYEGGILNGSKVEVHYFYNTTTNQYSNPYILQGKWSSYLNISK